MGDVDCSYNVWSNSIAFIKNNGNYNGFWRKGESDNDYAKQGDQSTTSFADDNSWHFNCMTMESSSGQSGN